MLTVGMEMIQGEKPSGNICLMDSDNLTFEKRIVTGIGDETLHGLL